MGLEHKIVGDDSSRLLTKRLDELAEERWKVVTCYAISGLTDGEVWHYALLQRHNAEPDEPEEFPSA